MDLAEVLQILDEFEAEQRAEPFREYYKRDLLGVILKQVRKRLMDADKASAPIRPKAAA